MAFPSTAGGEGPVWETLAQLAADPYFEVLEITRIKDPAVRDRVAALLADAAVEVKFGAQPLLLGRRLDLNSADPAARATAVGEVKAAIVEAAAVGARDIGVLSGRGVPEPDLPGAITRLEESLVELCSFAADRDVRVVLEVFDSDVDKRCLIGPAPRARELAERVRARAANFGLLVDLSHIVLLGETPEQALVPVREHLVHVHIGNAYFGPDRADPYWGDHHPRFGYPGGPNDVPQIADFLRVLLDIGYLRRDGSARGAISFELKPLGAVDAWSIIANARRKLSAAWARVS
jgi:sugar phosphate isomerase/epimerase